MRILLVSKAVSLSVLKISVLYSPDCLKGRHTLVSESLRHVLLLWKRQVSNLSDVLFVKKKYKKAACDHFIHCIFSKNIFFPEFYFWFVNVKIDFLSYAVHLNSKVSIWMLIRWVSLSLNWLHYIRKHFFNYLTVKLIPLIPAGFSWLEIKTNHNLLAVLWLANCLKVAPPVFFL